MFPHIQYFIKKSPGNAILSFTETPVALILAGSIRNNVEFLLFFLHVHNVVNM